ncbi:hypothetical protein Pst134EB_021972 [Puccinia striiformis f. sp. tritici]|nr:hypothetical protein Pst134EB_021972 [Puccinia striiformis f. sp. tritici]
MCHDKDKIPMSFAVRPYNMRHILMIGLLYAISSYSSSSIHRLRPRSMLTEAAEGAPACEEAESALKSGKGLKHSDDFGTLAIEKVIPIKDTQSPSDPAATSQRPRSKTELAVGENAKLTKPPV